MKLLVKVDRPLEAQKGPLSGPLSWELNLRLQLLSVLALLLRTGVVVVEMQRRLNREAGQDCSSQM